ncbi:MAG: hypothetical protein WCT04_04290 [Planctomycetota bacterium]
MLHASDKDVGDALIKGGAQVKYEGENAVSILFSSKSKDEPRDPTPEQLVQTGTLKHLKSLTIYNNCGATDETIGFIDGLDTLESAAINALKISDAGMSHFANVKNLKKLTLWHCFNKQFNGSGSAALAALPKLESYACDGSTFNDEGLKACAALKQVSALRFHHTAATDAGFVHLKGMENLKSLTLSTQFSVRIGDGSLAAIAEIPNLEKLEINETLLTYEGGLKHLKKLPKLKELVLKETEISDDDMSKLKADLSNTQIGWTKPKPEQAEKMKADLAKKKK